MATYASIKYDMDLSSNATGAGGMTLLSTQTASSSATVDFTSGIDSTYKEYIFKFIDIHCQTEDEDFCFQVDTGTNTNYNQTMTTTYFNAMHDEANTATSLEYNTTKDQAQAQGLSVLAYSLGADNDQTCSGELHLFEPSSTTFVKHFIGRSNNVTLSDYSIDSYMAGYVNTTTALTRVRFKMSSGNIDAGTIKMYGVS
jgi:hypothetical protein